LSSKALSDGESIFMLLSPQYYKPSLCAALFRRRNSFPETFILRLNEMVYARAPN
jgi:hypothetical protein